MTEVTANGHTYNDGDWDAVENPRGLAKGGHRQNSNFINLLLDVLAQAKAYALGGGYTWEYDSSTTMSDPGAGCFRFNGTKLEMAISATSLEGASVASLIPTWDDYGSAGFRGTVVTQLMGTGASVTARLGGTITNNSTWFLLTLAGPITVGTLMDGDAAVVSFMPTGSMEMGSSVTAGAGAKLFLDDAATSASAPALAFDGDSDTGIVRTAANTIAVVAGATAAMTATPSGATFAGTVTAAGVVSTGGMQLTGSGKMIYLRQVASVSRIDSYDDPITVTQPLNINSSQLRVSIADSEVFRVGTGGATAIGHTDTATAQLYVIGAGTGIRGDSTGSSATPIAGVATHASFAGPVCELLATRAATSAYNFLRAASAFGGSSDVEFLLRGDGNGLCDGSWTGGGADIAEFNEWKDGNPSSADRVGIAVVYDQDKIREALPGEVPLGVISGNPTVVMNAAWNKWGDKYLKDDFGRYLTEGYQVVSWTQHVPAVTVDVPEQAVETVTETTPGVEMRDGAAVFGMVTRTFKRKVVIAHDVVDESGEPVLATREINGTVFGEQLIFHEPVMVTRTVVIEGAKDIAHSYLLYEVPEGLAVPEDAEVSTQQRRILNPDYDANLDYLARAARPEWDAVGLLGRVSVRKGQIVNPAWVLLREISAEVDEYFIYPQNVQSYGA